MGIYSQIEGPIKRVLNDLFADEDLASDIRYRRFRDTAWSDADGAMVDRFRTFRIEGIRLRHTDRSKLVGIADIQIGDQLYLLRYEGAPNRMSLKDEIRDEFGNTQKLKDIANIFNLAIAITVEGGTSAIGS